MAFSDDSLDEVIEMIVGPVHLERDAAKSRIPRIQERHVASLPQGAEQLQASWRPGIRLARASDLRPDDLAVAELFDSPCARQSIDQRQTSPRNREGRG